MAFSSLSTRLAALPDVIVGPVLRLVLADQVNVFFALKNSAKVTVEVTNLTGLRVMVGTRSTVKIANNLHVVCIRATGTTPLAPDVGYVYNARFGTAGNDAVEAPGTRHLFTDGVIRATAADARALLTYPG